MKDSIKNPFLLFILLSLLAVATQGVDVWSHLVYNLGPLQIQKSKSIEIGLSLFSNPASLKYYYISYIVPWLKYGIVILTAAIIVRFLAYSLVYSICLECLGKKNLSIVATLIFMIPVAMSAHGVMANGLWAPPVLFPATLSALFTLVGLLLFLRAKDFSDFETFAEKKWTMRSFFILKQKSTCYVLAGIAFGLSIQFHGLYGTTAFAWLFIGS